MLHPTVLNTTTVPIGRASITDDWEHLGFLVLWRVRNCVRNSGCYWLMHFLRSTTYIPFSLMDSLRSRIAIRVREP